MKFIDATNMPEGCRQTAPLPGTEASSLGSSGVDAKVSVPH